MLCFTYNVVWGVICITFLSISTFSYLADSFLLTTKLTGRRLFNCRSRSLIICSAGSTSSDSNLKGFETFVRTNPLSDKISATAYHHVELYSGDATNTYKRFALGLGMELVAKSDQSTGNTVHASYVLRGGDMQFVFTAPYSRTIVTSPSQDGITSTVEAPMTEIEKLPFPSFNSKGCLEFFDKHGLAVKAVCLEVRDVPASYKTMIDNGAVSVLAPTRTTDKDPAIGYVDMAEVSLYGDVSLRLINSANYKGAFLPHFTDAKISASSSGKKRVDRNWWRFDHIVGNVWELKPTMERIKKLTVRHSSRHARIGCTHTHTHHFKSAVVTIYTSYKLYAHSL
jgi:4-hydroxyphenylpyruvate dioxygenase